MLTMMRLASSSFQSTCTIQLSLLCKHSPQNKKAFTDQGGMGLLLACVANDDVPLARAAAQVCVVYCSWLYITTEYNMIGLLAGIDSSAR